MKDLFDTPIYGAFSHVHENGAANKAIYKANKPRLTRNSRILYNLLIDGHKLTGIDCVMGVKYYNEVVRMTEYRRRFGEVKETLQYYGFDLTVRTLEKGCHEWSIDPEKVPAIRKAVGVVNV